MKFSLPKALLHLEGLTVLVASCVAYAIHGASWWKFAALFLAPDLAIIGFLFGLRVGTLAYNLGHTYVVVGVFWLVAHFCAWPHAWPISLIWIAHIGFDRFIGYGLKYSTAFKDTHLGRV
ncbi:MAG TPA: DUF4260 domain-containing protein [Lacunisphaera sp.]